MNCPSCDLPLLYRAAAKCPRCGYGLGDSGPINLPADNRVEARRSWVEASIVVAGALVVLGICAWLLS